MEHLNLVVGSMDVAKEFYVDFLGCTVDEGNGKHFNLGQQQVGMSWCLYCVYIVMMIMMPC
jgi:catechol 2,3-dioxygenase-like lactoylglutathione lyase family enzyme